jgi:hypothetical protein
MMPPLAVTGSDGANYTRGGKSQSAVIVPRLVKRVVKWLWGSVPTAPQPSRTKRDHYMRLNLRLPEVKPDQFVVPKQCPKAGCKGQHFIHARK